MCVCDKYDDPDAVFNVLFLYTSFGAASVIFTTDAIALLLFAKTTSHVPNTGGMVERARGGAISFPIRLAQPLGAQYLNETSSVPNFVEQSPKYSGQRCYIANGPSAIRVRRCRKCSQHFSRLFGWPPLNEADLFESRNSQNEKITRKLLSLYERVCFL